ncbi:MAG: hypothetical protein HQ500_12975 [Flavobacteriales bacterium]|nr:hypothetical protein [Flavobacteriales bacterium]
MKLKRVFIIIGASLLLLEALCFILAPAAQTEPAALLVNLEYMPYMLAAMTISFVAFFTLLFALILFILRGAIKQNLFGMFLMLVAFVLPIGLYYALY